MKLLQTLTDTLNKEILCPVTLKKGELIYDEDNTVKYLKLDFYANDLSSCLIDVCCYDSNGQFLMVMEEIPYKNKPLLIKLVSLLTTSVEIVVRKAECNGEIFQSKASFPLEKSPRTPVDFSDTSRLDIDEIERELEKKGLSKEQKNRLKKEKYDAEQNIRRMIKDDPSEKRKKVVSTIVALTLIVALAAASYLGVSYKLKADKAFNSAMDLYNSGKFEASIPALETAKNYIYFNENSQVATNSLAIAYARQRDFFNAGINFKALNGFEESKFNYRSIANALSSIVSANGNHSLLLRDNGTAVAVGDNIFEQCNVTDFSNIIRVSAGGNHSLALKRDGSVLAVGDNTYGQCDVENINNIIDISAGENHSVMVEKIGRVTAMGDNSYNQCDVGAWSAVVSVSAGTSHTVGLRIDGTAVAVGNNSHKECEVGAWTDVVSVSAGNGFTAGLKYNGEVICTGMNIPEIKNAFLIDAGGNTLLVLHTDGTVSCYGNSDYTSSISNWENIISISAGKNHCLGVSKDGSVLSSNLSAKEQNELAKLTNIKIPKGTVTIRK